MRAKTFDLRATHLGAETALNAGNWSGWWGEQHKNQSDQMVGGGRSGNFPSVPAVTVAMAIWPGGLVAASYQERSRVLVVATPCPGLFGRPRWLSGCAGYQASAYGVLNFKGA